MAIQKGSYRDLALRLLISTGSATILATGYSLAFGYGAAHVGAAKVWPDVPLTFFIAFLAFYAGSLLLAKLPFSKLIANESWAILLAGGLLLAGFQFLLRTIFLPAGALAVMAYVGSGFALGLLAALPLVAACRWIGKMS